MTHSGTQKLTFPQAISQTLHEEMKRNRDVFVMGEDIAHYNGMFRCTDGLLKAFGESRVIDTPISESGFVGMALGAALVGKRPVVELMFVDFSMVAMDQILNQIAKTRYMSGGKVDVPLVIRTQGGGYKGAAAQHSQMLETFFIHVPGLRVVCPADPRTAKGLLASAIRSQDPVIFIEHKQLYGMSGDVPEGEYLLNLDHAEVVRPGADITLISYSYTLALAAEAAKNLATKWIEVEVIDLRSLNPVDWPTLEASIRKTHNVLIAHESHLRCGIGSDLACQIQEKFFDELDSPVGRVGGVDTPIPFAQVLEEAHLPSAEKIELAVMDQLGRR